MLGGISFGELDIDGSWGMSWKIKSFFYRSTTDMRGEPSHTGELKLTPGNAAALLSAYDEACNRLGIEDGRPLPLSLPTDTEILNRKIIMHPGVSPLFRFFEKVDRATRVVEGGFATEAQQNLKNWYHVVVQNFRKVTGSTSTRAAELTERLRQFSANWRLGRIEGSRAPDLRAGGMVKPEAPRQVDLGVRLRRTYDETNGDPGTAEQTHRHRQRMQRGEGGGMRRGLLFGPQQQQRTDGWGGSFRVLNTAPSWQGGPIQGGENGDTMADVQSPVNPA
uniref:Uncharacterized protein n=1 Tax=Chromera velia CCMP2878 TaxID=1169474 RepID=A0A0G4HJW5_9ALVE|eukprot:Cvel_28394.t1-p1 / transcript=Cvel_28394.t1 / gene=Cvel_28394 / organism=Chromera_velia_CCMP2878 / gene_product=hypothetical protein / transcript_product=hypothetical protein / location=Cvel_scaffold3709:3934-4764(-) / protein_length=277 / sequence_SO=supercontig / SO=protein_coding / is_pseudo=false